MTMFAMDPLHAARPASSSPQAARRYLQGSSTCDKPGSWQLRLFLLAILCMPITVHCQVIAKRHPGRAMHDSSHDDGAEAVLDRLSGNGSAANGTGTSGSSARLAGRLEMSALEIDGELMPALGPTWAHCVSTRVSATQCIMCPHCFERG